MDQLSIYLNILVILNSFNLLQVELILVKEITLNNFVLKVKQKTVIHHLNDSNNQFKFCLNIDSNKGDSLWF